MTDAVRILAFHVSPRAIDGNAQHGLLGHIDVQLPGVTLFGVKFHRTRRGDFAVIGPRTEPTATGSNGARIDDDALRAQIIGVACRAAAAFGVNVAAVEADDAAAEAVHPPTGEATW